MPGATPNFETIQDDFAFLDDWEDRYRYVIELGKTLAPLSPDEKNELTRVSGCASQVWLVTDAADDGQTLRLRGESDAMIVQGLIAILVALYSEKTAPEILDVDARGLLAGLGLADHLTQQRANGLSAMIERMRAIAADHVGT